MDNPERIEQVPPVLDSLVAELSEQVRFLREELLRARAEAEESRQHAAELLAAKDTQIERLLALLEGRWAAGPAAVLEEAEEEEAGELAIPAETEPDRVETIPVDAPRSVPVSTLRRGFKTHADICPYLRARYDQSSAHTYATKNNGCWSPRIKKVRRQLYGEVDNKQQNTYCLHDRYTQCVYFESTTETPAETVPAEAAEQEKRWWQRKGQARR